MIKKHLNHQGIMIITSYQQSSGTIMEISSLQLPLIIS